MQWLLDRFSAAPDRAAFIHRDRKVRYGEVIALIERYRALLRDRGLVRGDRAVVLGDYSPELFCMLIALALEGGIVIPLSREAVVERASALAISGCEWLIDYDEAGVSATVSRHEVAAESPLLAALRASGHPGLLLFSSGSTGRPKAILHDFDRVAAKFIKQRAAVIAIPFLMIDHFGGINTILGIVASLGTVVTVANRGIDSICRAIETHRVELLPTTPSFLTMLMASGLDGDYDLSSLKRITYGTEVMPQGTLDRVRQRFPGVMLQQTYGLSEVGVMRSQSRDDGSLWVRIGGEGFQTKVVDDILWIRSDYAMLGYLNAPSEFDADGWFNTQDRVEVDGDYFRILGRVTDLINVGGQKVYPAEVEEVILGLDNVADVAVYGEAHPLLGQVVVAKVLTSAPEGVIDLKRRIRAACGAALTNYKVPAKVLLADGPLYTARQKKRRA
ncbi:class I adenylate-forming enzyme family protein [Sphingomonas sp. BK345]|uniref:class I adenylate-forming enzyme family protein n=1 Tax=Sphingomonas sp. BK345 TaxID=2586980 RepID=UPI0016148D8E|nr:fatty acid--CoA ligase family protein [Sphingomonas sp. BK345]MBB3475876.1 acyl-CoA synthetase (AMP-forming)/AMP-acid ligase II [Sphingomonas sp. BK345]